jgi:riboflavin synthase
LKVYLIPHTLKTTTLGAKKKGDSINIEFDMIGKYIARIESLRSGGRITEGFLKEKGF